jgi:hypothetical protein
VTLDGNQLQASPEITTKLYSPAPAGITSSQAPITKALKFFTSGSSDFCEVVITYRGSIPGETPGLFNGMKWKDFITNGETLVRPLGSYSTDSNSCGVSNEFTHRRTWFSMDSMCYSH